MNFIVCSFGGCGSWILAQYLSHFGKVHHCHSRTPPLKLTTVKDEHFTNEEVDVQTSRVIYVYRDPRKAMASVGRRWEWRDHLRNIEVDPCLTPADVGDEDPFALAEFHNNYITRTERNYRILCVKYEDLWENFSGLNAVIGLPDKPAFYPCKMESIVEPLEKVAWKRLADSMKDLPPLFFS